MCHSCPRSLDFHSLDSFTWVALSLAFGEYFMLVNELVSGDDFVQWANLWRKSHWREQHCLTAEERAESEFVMNCGEDATLGHCPWITASPTTAFPLLLLVLLPSSIPVHSPCALLPHCLLLHRWPYPIFLPSIQSLWKMVTLQKGADLARQKHYYHF